MSIERIQQLESGLHGVKQEVNAVKGDIGKLSRCTSELTTNVSVLCKSMDRLADEMAQASKDNREQLSHMARAEEWRNQQTNVNRTLGEHLGRHDVEINDVRMKQAEIITKLAPVWGAYMQIAGYGIAAIAGAAGVYLGVK